MELRSHWPVNLAEDFAQPHTQVEWWFVQGFFENEDQSDGPDRKEFMTTLFRYRLPFPVNGQNHAFSTLMTVLDVKTGRSSVVSEVDPVTCEFLVKLGRFAPPPGFDPLIVRTIADEVDEFGPPLPIARQAANVHLQVRPFRAAWNGFSIEHQEDQIHLRFKEPSSAAACRFQLRPLHPRIHLSDIAPVGKESMEYVSYTRLALEGCRNKRRVRGQAWMDHQWGSHGWLVGGVREDQVLGWDWMGIQLDGGKDLLVMAHRDQDRGHRLLQYAILVDGNNPPQLIRDFQLEPTAWWDSAATRARYPLQWRLTIPQLDLQLQFTPFADDQELPMLAPMRAVWEGAGTVAGTLAGIPISGRARLELHGYAYMRDVRKQLDQFAGVLDQTLQQFLPRQLTQQALQRLVGNDQDLFDPAAQTALLATPLWDLLDRGGERWFSVLGLLVLAALGAPTQPHELLVAFTSAMVIGSVSVIDDIQDNTSERRGSPALHVRYGLNVALNAGTTAMMLPLALLRDYPNLSDAQRLKLYELFSSLYVRMALGQNQDLYWSNHLSPENLRLWTSQDLGPKILQTYAQKSGSMVACAAQGAAVIANADPDMTRACAAFGDAFGTAMQIIDDLMDFSPFRSAGGKVGADLESGKLTYVIYHALKILPPDQRDRLAAILTTPALRHDPLVRAQAIDLVRNSGAMEACRQQAVTLVESQWAQLSKTLPTSEPKTMLRVFCRFILALGEQEPNLDIAP